MEDTSGVPPARRVDAMTCDYERECERCGAPVSEGTSYCPVHDPELSNEPLGPRVEATVEAKRIRDEMRG